jgi:hypothetical protein
MKYGYILVLATVSLMAFNAFGESEMDSEINDLQVRIIHVKPEAKAKKVTKAHPNVIDGQEVTPKIYTYTARPPVKTAVTRPIRANFYKPTVVSKPTYVAANDVSVAPVTPVAPAPTTRHQVDNNGNTNNFQASENYQSYSNETQPAEGNVHGPAPKASIFSGQLVRRIELIPAFTISSFDGGDASTLQPNGVSNTSNTGFSGQLLTDIDFGNEHFFVESGFMFSQMGAGTGQAMGNGIGGSTTATSEKEVLSYAGVPLDLKLRFRDQDQSSIYVKAGGTPMFMLSHAYTTNGSSLYGYSPEQRFGAYNTFDLLLNAGVGYDIRISKDFHAIADVSAFQGLFPVLTNYSVFNYGVNLGLGIAYML